MGVNHAVLVLERSFYYEELTPRNQQTLALIKVWSDDHIGSTAFVLHRKEDEPFCGTWSLPCNHTSGSSYIFSVLAFPIPGLTRFAAAAVQVFDKPSDAFRL
jgi:hypothetical protein